VHLCKDREQLKLRYRIKAVSGYKHYTTNTVVLTHNIPKLKNASVVAMKPTHKNPTKTKATATNDSPLTLMMSPPLVPSAVLPTSGFVVVDALVVDVPLAATAALVLTAAYVEVELT
jgi:hypothetical protein